MGVVDSAAMTGIEHGDQLIAFATAVLGKDLDLLDTARAALASAMGPDAVVAASIVAASFSLVDRAANGIGIAVEPMVLKPSADFRAELGINDFPSAANTLD